MRIDWVANDSEELLPMGFRQLMLTGVFTLLLGACGGGGEQQRLALTAVAGGALLVDVRSAEEVKSGTLEGAINIPHTDIVPELAKLNIAKDQPIVVFCRSGNRSGKAATALAGEGYTHIINGGGYADLQATRLAMVNESSCTAAADCGEQP